MRSTSLTALASALVLLVFAACASTPPPKPQPKPAPAKKEPLTGLTAEKLEEVQTVVRAGMPSLNLCYRDEAEKHEKKVKIHVMVKILIGTNSHAKMVTIQKSSTDSPSFKACMIKTIKGWEFPKLKAEAPFTFPFHFEPAY
jgi:hypothetical protein